ncbi:GTP cyclohydrolase I FolE [Candidatus Woesearchaeota archaeon]|nr:GTP cyclohydrolase I FolE [Candidatus Woesearchaeota archaeon]
MEKHNCDLRHCFKNLIVKLGENPDRMGLKETPERAAEAIEFLTKGYRQDLREVVNDAIFPSNNDEMVVVKNIEFYSLCEHHILPFFGQAHVGYIPDGKILGVSKIARITDVFARRLQIQENLTKQIADAVLKFSGAKGVGVILEARHLCMMMRGVEKQNSAMRTSCMLGCFKTNQATRNEFLQSIG